MTEFLQNFSIILCTRDYSNYSDQKQNTICDEKYCTYKKSILHDLSFKNKLGYNHLFFFHNDFNESSQNRFIKRPEIS